MIKRSTETESPRGDSENVDKERTLLIADDDEAIARGLSLIFSEKGYEVETAGTGQEAFEKACMRFFNLIADNIPDSVSYVDADGRYRFVNKRYEEWFGIPRTEIIGKHYRQVLGEATYDLIKGHVEAVLSGQRVRYEEALPYVRGGTRWVSADYVPDTDEQGKVKGFFALVTDISRRKRAEQALCESEERYRSLFNGVPVGFYRATPYGQNLDANPAALQMLGYPDLASLQAVNVASIYLNPEDRRRWQALIEQEGVVRDFEVQLRCRDGTVIWVRDTARAVRDADGQVLYYEGVLEDITERKQLQAQLLQSQKMEAVGRLASGVAHDFSNWLTAIQGYTGMAMEQVDEADPLYKDLQQIQISAARAGDLTRKLLLFSRRQVIAFKSFNLNGTVEGLLKMLHRLIGEDITIEVTLEPDLWPTRGDEANMEQIIMNLAINARDAMPEGGTLTIRTENVTLDQTYCRMIPDARPGKYVRLSVEDTGIGMDEEVKQHLFEPFFTAKEPGEGTGLGLSIVYGIVKQHEGWINVYSEPGRGSVFRIYLPASPTEDITEIKEDVSWGWLQGSGERILLVEDDKLVRETVRRALERNGYVVLAAATVAEVLDVFGKEEGKFDLFFGDVVLPDGSGLRLASELLYHNPELRVLLSSGYTDEKSRRTVIQDRRFHFLQKPYGLFDLLRTIREIISQAK